MEGAQGHHRRDRAGGRGLRAHGLARDQRPLRRRPADPRAGRGAAARHGYRRRAARPPAEPGLIDLVFNDLDSPWAVEIIRGVEDVAHAAGVGTVVSAIHRRSASARQWLENLRPAPPRASSS